MKRESEFQKNIDIGRIFESTLLGVFVLLGSYVNTIYLFFKNPTELTGVLDEDSRVTSMNRHKSVRPLTFLVMSEIVLIAGSISVSMGIEHTHKMTSPIPIDRVIQSNAEPPLEILFKNGLKEFNTNKMLLAVLPPILIIGVFSYGITRSARKNGYDFIFTKSIGLASYCNGSNAVVSYIPWALGLLIYYYLDYQLTDIARWSEFWISGFVVWSLLYLLLSLRTFYCYLAILKTELAITWKKAFAIWLGGLWRFLLFLIPVVMLLIPLVKYFKSS